MSRHLERELTSLRKRIVTVGAMAEGMLRDAVRAVESRDVAAARAVIDRDAAVDAYENETEEECLKILALHQPVAEPLRFVAAVLKINNDVERLADQAVNIAERAIRLAGRSAAGVASGLHDMAERVMAMVRQALDALVDMDKRRALDVCRSDDAVDEAYKSLCATVERNMIANPAEIPAGLDVIAVLKNLERCADLATNIAEDVAYAVDGRIIRHPSLARRSAP